MTDWLQSLTPRDWLLDGHPIRGRAMIEAFNQLDWSKAWMDMGPSPTGNPGPYWHVPDSDGDATHRLYPKLAPKWLPLVRRAVEETVETARRHFMGAA